MTSSETLDRWLALIKTGVDVVPSVARGDGEALPSVGSALHPAECVPCARFQQFGSCKEAASCEDCHIPHFLAFSCLA